MCGGPFCDFFSIISLHTQRNREEKQAAICENARRTPAVTKRERDANDAVLYSSA